LIDKKLNMDALHETVDALFGEGIAFLAFVYLVLDQRGIKKLSPYTKGEAISKLAGALLKVAKYYPKNIPAEFKKFTYLDWVELIEKKFA
jgi:hypothetical protein